MIRAVPTTLYEPGQFVRLKSAPDWGTGQIQSVVGNRVTVNFEHAGKRLIIAGHVELDIVKDQDAT